MKDLLGGGLKPNDPRRFLIEAMVGAMNADGVVDPREPRRSSADREHPLFQGLGAAAARTLIDLSNDAIRFAGSALGRAPAIAKGLPARIHRLAAYGMAAEVAAADQQLVDGRAAASSRRCASRCGSARSRRRAIVHAARTGQLAAVPRRSLPARRSR